MKTYRGNCHCGSFVYGIAFSLLNSLLDTQSAQGAWVLGIIKNTNHSSE